jgi:hypothetical protein
MVVHQLQHFGALLAPRWRRFCPPAGGAAGAGGAGGDLTRFAGRTGAAADRFY